MRQNSDAIVGKPASALGIAPTRKPHRPPRLVGRLMKRRRGKPASLESAISRHQIDARKLVGSLERLGATMAEGRGDRPSLAALLPVTGAAQNDLWLQLLRGSGGRQASLAEEASYRYKTVLSDSNAGSFDSSPKERHLADAASGISAGSADDRRSEIAASPINEILQSLSHESRAATAVTLEMRVLRLSEEAKRRRRRMK